MIDNFMMEISFYGFLDVWMFLFVPDLEVLLRPKIQMFQNNSTKRIVSDFRTC